MSQLTVSLSYVSSLTARLTAAEGAADFTTCTAVGQCGHQWPSTGGGGERACASRHQFEQSDRTSSSVITC